ncbi:putative lysophospholipase [Tilletiaria anomala UBC 951]|uniref:Lysophospholipase n=1 Tax=Tilletiaria anomala (strain ATCC 24038 / CBS 436.72 / UBC 951) TaxID=1037660 RepID=A0A066W4Y5_TILAU|nr:putative lysophospholipase [Tilletiaria anomala UBC 951]KDN46144.1 putative lysophospholipase [Tilletiaria anomala UBC 951]
MRTLALTPRSAPSGDYAPSTISCPAASAANASAGLSYSGQLRNASTRTLNPDEANYIAQHRAAKQADWTSWLSQSQVGLDAAVPGGFSNYTGGNASRVPRIAIATSGGGLRAMLYGAGVFSALDSRNSTATQVGTGGLLQLADYVTGLSGGSWLTGSVALNDYPTTQSLHDGTWDLESNLIVPQDNALNFYANIIEDVDEKRSYATSNYTGITDYWGRALSYHLLNSTKYANHGAATTWSDVRNVSNFQSFAYPFPIVIADQRNPGELFIETTSPIWEFTPYEWGTWDDDIAAFLPIDLIGSQLNNGTSTVEGQCTAGWDNAGWSMGTSSTLFNSLFTTLVTSEGDSAIKAAIEKVLAQVGQQYNDISLVPNSFFGYRNGTNPDALSPNISLVDGGEDGQNVPLWPVINPVRELDFVLAVDSSADVSSWPNGTSLVATSQRVQNDTFAQYPFPNIPRVNTFINRGLNTRPTFFGCPGASIINADTALNDQQTPLIAYLPNYPYESLANTSTFQLEYSQAQSQAVMDNAFAVATLSGIDTALNGTDLAWPKCLACGMLLRSFQRSGTPIPPACQTCYNAYCWDGQSNDTVPANPYSPPVGVPEFVSSRGMLLRAPAYTGGNGSSPGNPSAPGIGSRSSGSRNSNAAPAVLLGAPRCQTATALGALFATSAVLLM